MTRQLAEDVRAPDAANARRKSSSDRRAEILEAATQLIVETRSLPLSMNDIGERIGASRGLVYAHFSDQDAIVQAVLAEHFALLEESGLDRAAGQGGVAERGVAIADIYLRHVAQHGPVLHVILRDAPHGVSLLPGATRPRNRSLRALANLARRELRLTSAEAIVLVELLIAIPEELGRLARAAEIDLQDAAAICERLIRSSIEALRPR